MSALQQNALPGICQWCGAQLDRVRTDALYCSPAHKQAHYRWRKRLQTAQMRASLAVDQISDYQDHPVMVGEAREALELLQKQVKSALKAGTR